MILACPIEHMIVIANLLVHAKKRWKQKDISLFWPWFWPISASLGQFQPNLVNFGRFWLESVRISLYQLELAHVGVNSKKKKKKGELTHQRSIVASLRVWCRCSTHFATSMLQREILVIGLCFKQFWLIIYND